MENRRVKMTKMLRDTLQELMEKNPRKRSLSRRSGVQLLRHRYAGQPAS